MSRRSEFGMPAIYNTTHPTLGDGQGSALAVDTLGRLVLSTTLGAGALSTPVAIRATGVLTGSYVASTAQDVSAYSQLMFHIQFTKGNADSMYLKVEFSQDNSVWVQETFELVNGAEAVGTLGYHPYTVTGNYRLPIEVCDKYVRVSVIGNGADVTNSNAIISMAGR